MAATRDQVHAPPGPSRGRADPGSPWPTELARGGLAWSAGANLLRAVSCTRVDTENKKAMSRISREICVLSHPILYMERCGDRVSGVVSSNMRDWNSCMLRRVTHALRWQPTRPRRRCSRRRSSVAATPPAPPASTGRPSWRSLRSSAPWYHAHRTQTLPASVPPAAAHAQLVALAAGLLCRAGAGQPATNLLRGAQRRSRACSRRRAPAQAQAESED